MKILCICGIGLLLVAGAYLLRNAQNPLKVPLIQRVRLIDVDAVRSRAEFLCPDALDYNLLIAFPINSSGSSESGEIYLSEGGTNSLRLSLSSTSLVSCTWLDNFGGNGFIIRPPNNQQLSSYLRGGSNYSVAVKNVPLGSSVWLDFRYPSGWNVTKRHRAQFQKKHLPVGGE
jgi:hypothetical protein